MGKDAKENCIKDALKWVMQMYIVNKEMETDQDNFYADYSGKVASDSLGKMCLIPLNTKETLCLK